jgi:hypothetical protein
MLLGDNTVGGFVMLGLIRCHCVGNFDFNWTTSYKHYTVDHMCTRYRPVLSLLGRNPLPSTARWLNVDGLFPKRGFNLGTNEYVTQSQTSAATLYCSRLLKSA